MTAIREATYDPVHGAQQHFRILLDAMARPGKLVHLHDAAIQPPAGLHGASALVALALLDAEASFCASEAHAGYLQINTGAPRVHAAEADFIFVSGRGDLDACRRAKIGTLRYPEGGATLVIDVEHIATTASDNALVLTLKGPGIDGERTVYACGLNTELLEIRAEKNEEFPTGVDLILTDGEGSVCCLPRTAQVRWS